jgi:hypothetical protein
VKNESSGYVMILFAAKEASETFKDHWLRHCILTHHARPKRCKTNWGRQMAVSSLFGDIETLVEDLRQYERE